ncbi:galactose-binding domain-like protein, partial [Cokeromyces recurvatus]|uniref:galactose-binding domain-like protein n=1 Tax=Cokeromyces recurvatus TaxID=90255 RepID=UPI00221E802B
SVTIKLCNQSKIIGFDIDTTGFTDSSASYINIEGYQDSDAIWQSLLPEVPINADSHNFFEFNSNKLYSKIRLNIAPGGGIGRLRVYGDITPDFTDKSREYNMSAANLGARIVRWTDQGYANKSNILLNHGTKINDFVVIQLATSCKPNSIIIDTTGFENNAPKNVFIQGCYSEDTDPHYDPFANWVSLIVPDNNKLLAGGLSTFDIHDDIVISHIRLYLIPDGGVQQIKVIGTPVTKEKLKDGPLLIEQGPQVKSIRNNEEEEGIIIEELEEGELVQDEITTVEEVVVTKENNNNNMSASKHAKLAVEEQQSKKDFVEVKIEPGITTPITVNNRKRMSSYEEEARLKRQCMKSRRNFPSGEWFQ